MTVALTQNGLDPRARQAVLLMVTVGVATGILQLVGTGSMQQLWFSMGVLSFMGFAGLGLLLTVPSYATPWSIYGVSIALGYGFGALNTMARGYTEGLSLLQVTYANVPAIGRAEGAMLLLTSMLMYVGVVDKVKIIPTVRFNMIEQRAALVMLALVAAGAALAVATGNLGYQGSQGAEEGSGRVSALGAIITSSMTSVMASAVFAFAHEKKGRTRLLIAGLCLILMMTLMIQGRRVFMYGMLVSVIAFFAARGARQFFTFKSLLILLMVGSLVMVTSRFYFAMRIASYAAGPNPTLVDLVKGGFDVVMNAEAEGLDERNDENQATRTFIVGYLSELMTASETHEMIGGDLLLLNTVSAVPTVIWPGKWKIMSRGGSEENMCHPVLGLPIWDAANTSVTAGLCDLSWLGMFLYPLGVAAMYAVANRAMLRTPLLVRCIVCFATFENLFQVENAINSYFVGLRNIFSLAIIAWVVVWILGWFQNLPGQRLLRKRRAQLRRLRRRQQPLGTTKGAT